MSPGFTEQFGLHQAACCQTRSVYQNRGVLQTQMSDFLSQRFSTNLYAPSRPHPALPPYLHPPPPPRPAGSWRSMHRAASLPPNPSPHPTGRNFWDGQMVHPLLLLLLLLGAGVGRAVKASPSPEPRACAHRSNRGD